MRAINELLLLLAYRPREQLEILAGVSHNLLVHCLVGQAALDHSRNGAVERLEERLEFLLTCKRVSEV